VSENLLRAVVQAPSSEREVAIATLLELAPQGFEEVERDGVVELAVYTDTYGVAGLEQAFGSVVVSPVEQGWEERWREFHRPAVAGGLWIGPPWLTPPHDRPAVVIDPGRAFGTGAHPTTRLCVELLAETQRGSLLDVGCGSGVLAIAAARLGFAPVVAVDVDAVAVEVTRANAAVNGVELDTRLLDAMRDPLPQADVAVVNVLVEPVVAILASLESPTAIVSGYLERDLPAHPGWKRVDRRVDGGWAADRLTRA
jgi:ribosomal protein L11 methyltransferase